jgi:Zn-dependent protease
MAPVDLSPDKMKFIVVNLIILILSIAVHEFGHAFVADWLGDRLPRSEGRVTLSPIAHVDPIGTLLVPTVMMLFGGGLGFGWGKPVRVNPPAFSRRFSMRTGHMLVAAAGPAMNLIFGTLIAIVLLILWKTGVLPASSPIFSSVEYAILLNYMLLFFNLIPLAPLDGQTVASTFIPYRHQRAWDQVQSFGPWILLAIIASPRVGAIFAWPAMQLFIAVHKLLGFF